MNCSSIRSRPSFVPDPVGRYAVRSFSTSTQLREKIEKTIAIPTSRKIRFRLSTIKVATRTMTFGLFSFVCSIGSVPSVPCFRILPDKNKKRSFMFATVCSSRANHSRKEFFSFRDTIFDYND